MPPPLPKRSINSLNMLFRGPQGDARIEQYIDDIQQGNIPAKLAAKYAGFKVTGQNHLYFGTRRVVPQADIDEVLTQLYETDSNTAGKGSVNFYKYVSEKYLNILRSDCAAFLQKQPAYQLAKEAKHRVNKPILAKYPNQTWGLDLIDCSAYASKNQQFRYILTVVDLFSRKVWLGKLKLKEPRFVVAQFQSIVNRAGVVPDSLLSDNGTEFKGDFREYLLQHEIQPRYSRAYSPQSNGLVERANLDIRRIARALMVRNNDQKWATRLSEIESAKNSAYNSSIKATADAVWVPNKTRLSVRDLPGALAGNNAQLAARLSLKQKAIRDVASFRQTEFDLGDEVRVKMSALFSDVRRKTKAGLTKELPVTWSPDIFVIHRAIQPRQSLLERKRYVLRNDEGELVKHRKSGRGHQFYATDLLDSRGAEPGDISMDRALDLNGAKRTDSDLLH